MPTIKCDSSLCPLTTGAELTKFCSECGALTSTKVVPDNSCRSCSHNFGDVTPKFCPECGTPSQAQVDASFRPLRLPMEPMESPEPPTEKVYGTLDNLIAQHEQAKAQRGLPGGSKGRGLTPEELARLERGMRKPADRTYQPPTPTDSDAFRSVSSLDVPEQSVVDQFAPRRTALRAENGKHSPGLLSSRSARLEPDYHNHVRVIPYTFRHAARNERVGAHTAPVPEEDSNSLFVEDRLLDAHDAITKKSSE